MLSASSKRTDCDDNHLIPQIRNESCCIGQCSRQALTVRVAHTVVCGLSAAEFFDSTFTEKLHVLKADSFQCQCHRLLCEIPLVGGIVEKPKQAYRSTRSAVQQANKMADNTAL